MTEEQLIRRLQRLAADWPDGYMLASMGGTLCLFRTDDRLKPDVSQSGFVGDALDHEKVLWSTIKIPSTGGDW